MKTKTPNRGKRQDAITGFRSEYFENRAQLGYNQEVHLIVFLAGRVENRHFFIVLEACSALRLRNQAWTTGRDMGM